MTSLLKWAAQAKRGDSIVYFSGDLAYSREAAALNHRNNKHTLDRDALDRANEAAELQKKGKVALVQKRTGVAKFDYIAQKR